MRNQRSSKLCRAAVLAGVTLAAAFGAAVNVMAQALKDVQTPDTPLVLKAPWQARFEACQAMISRIKSAGGQAEMLAPPERGIRGNSHMIMWDKNNLQISDLILQWLDARVSKRGEQVIRETWSPRDRPGISGAGART